LLPPPQTLPAIPPPPLQMVERTTTEEMEVPSTLTIKTLRPPPKAVAKTGTAPTPSPPSDVVKKSQKLQSLIKRKVRLPLPSLPLNFMIIIVIIIIMFIKNEFNNHTDNKIDIPIQTSK
jgi:hypothetical protein